MLGPGRGPAPTARSGRLPAARVGEPDDGDDVRWTFRMRDAKLSRSFENRRFVARPLRPRPARGACRFRTLRGGPRLDSMAGPATRRTGRNIPLPRWIRSRPPRGRPSVVHPPGRKMCRGQAGRDDETESERLPVGQEVRPCPWKSA